MRSHRGPAATAGPSRRGRSRFHGTRPTLTGTTPPGWLGDGTRCRMTCREVALEANPAEVIEQQLTAPTEASQRG